MKKKTKVLVLFSGGLDSLLAVKYFLNLGFETEAITFASPFWGLDSAKRGARNLGVKLNIVDFSRKHLKMLKAPRYGYGKNMNPCIDCHTLMISEAWKIAKKNKFDFLATGEVLGERPMSQNKNSLENVALNSGAKGFLVRPLSGKLLEKTIPEERGLIRREDLFSIEGRSRKPQLELAKKWDIKDFPNASGGCLLTDFSYSEKLKQLFEKWPDFDQSDASLIKFGRVFYEKEGVIIIGRNREDNDKIENISQPKDILIKLKDIPGPLGLVRIKSKASSENLLKKACCLILSYKKIKHSSFIYGENSFNKEISI
jgi:hypothetical protein